MGVRGPGRLAGSARIYAILVTAALHLAVAAIVIGGRPTAPPAPVLQTAAITLLPLAVEPETVAAATAPSPKPAPTRSTAAPAAPPEVSAPVLPAALPPTPPIAQAITPPPRAEPAPSNDDAVRDDYARRLWQWIAARRPQGLRLEGEAVVAFRVSRDGALSDIELARASGSKPLDRLALRTVRLSAPVPRPPGTLPDEALHFTLTFHFR